MENLVWLEILNMPSYYAEGLNGNSFSNRIQKKKQVETRQNSGKLMLLGNFFTNGINLTTEMGAGPVRQKGNSRRLQPRHMFLRNFLINKGRHRTAEMSWVQGRRTKRKTSILKFLPPSLPDALKMYPVSLPPFLWNVPFFISFQFPFVTFYRHFLCALSR